MLLLPADRIDQVERFPGQRNQAICFSLKTAPGQIPVAAIPAALHLIPWVVRASPMSKENQAHQEQKYEEIILPDHDVLLFLCSASNRSIALSVGE